jgi:hypothetical protein
MVGGLATLQHIEGIGVQRLPWPSFAAGPEHAHLRCVRSPTPKVPPIQRAADMAGARIEFAAHDLAVAALHFNPGIDGIAVWPILAQAELQEMAEFLRDCSSRFPRSPNGLRRQDQVSHQD